MNRTMYVVIISDRHSDDDLELFFGKDAALKRAEEATAEMLRHYRVELGDCDAELNDLMLQSGWLYYVSREDAGSVRVETHLPKDVE